MRKSLKMDLGIANFRPSHGKVCFELDSKVTLPHHAWLGLDSEGCWQNFTYENLSLFCTKYNMQGHSEFECLKRNKATAENGVTQKRVPIEAQQTTSINERTANSNANPNATLKAGNLEVVPFSGVIVVEEDPAISPLPVMTELVVVCLQADEETTERPDTNQLPTIQ
ncbi:hypothetical protein ACH5RR_001397 [Cinchona calisaya]|uniref:Uncharacterized protein n=1 Tax=Cinchona calisaya TaxID=153742 RepID=A0ABD3B3Q4_9GENT